jgi:hypothetical protein
MFGYKENLVEGDCTVDISYEVNMWRVIFEDFRQKDWG